MYTIYVSYKCVPGKREEWLRQLNEKGYVAAIRAEEGCIRYDYYLAEKNPDEVLLIEAWETKAHQQAHIQTPHMALVKQMNAAFVESVKIGEYKILD